MVGLVWLSRVARPPNLCRVGFVGCASCPEGTSGRSLILTEPLDSRSCDQSRSHWPLAAIIFGPAAEGRTMHRIEHSYVASLLRLYCLSVVLGCAVRHWVRGGLAFEIRGAHARLLKVIAQFHVLRQFRTPGSLHDGGDEHIGRIEQQLEPTADPSLPTTANNEPWRPTEQGIMRGAEYEPEQPCILFFSCVCSG
jgi:hypothetical protein